MQLPQCCYQKGQLHVICQEVESLIHLTWLKAQLYHPTCWRVGARDFLSARALLWLAECTGSTAGCVVLTITDDIS